MARELIGLGQLIAHVFDDVTSPTNLATDSASARQVSMMSGFLRRMRHVDLRLCFLQETPIVLKRSALKEGPLWPKRWALFNLEAP